MALEHDRQAAVTRRVVGVAALATVVLRLPMLWSAVSVDEGAYLAAARTWAHGRVLYRDVFVDRPQGLFVLFRVWDWLSGGNTGSIRILTMVFGVVLVLATAVVVYEVAGHTAARAAAVLCGVLSAAPMLEGYAANTEVLASAVSAAALAAGLVGWSRARSAAWWIGAGALAAFAMTIRQSGFDGLAALLATLVVTAWTSPAQRHAAIRASWSVIGGAVMVLTAMAVHGALIGWDRWWFAMFGYRFRSQSLFADAYWGNLASTVRYAAVVLGGCAVLALAGARRLRETFARRGTPVHPTHGALVAPISWLVASFAGFMLGGGFWRHYWMLLVGPLCALAGIGVASMRSRRFVVALAMAPSLAVAVWVYAGGAAQLNVRAAGDHRAALDLRVGRWFDHHRARGQTLYVLCSSAAAYADAHEDPAYPFLWQFDLAHVPHGEAMLVRYLADPARRPTFIAAYQDPRWCDPTGRVAAILAGTYRQVASVGGVPILEDVRFRPASATDTPDVAAASGAPPVVGRPLPSSGRLRA